jgi:hypothetical protein
MMEAVRTSETSVDNHFTRQYIPEDNSEQVIFKFEMKCFASKKERVKDELLLMQTYEYSLRKCFLVSSLTNYSSKVAPELKLILKP